MQDRACREALRIDPRVLFTPETAGQYTSLEKVRCVPSYGERAQRAILRQNLLVDIDGANRLFVRCCS